MQLSIRGVCTTYLTKQAKDMYKIPYVVASLKALPERHALISLDSPLVHNSIIHSPNAQQPLQETDAANVHAPPPYRPHTHTPIPPSS